MSDYPFSLKGAQRSFKGRGGPNYKSEEFPLKQGVVVAEITHHGNGDFKLRFVSTEGFSEGQATAAGLGAAAASGAAIGSIVPGLGTIVGGLVGAGAGWLAGGTVGEMLAPSIWIPAEVTGEFSTYSIVQVHEGTDGALSPGNYRIEVESNGRWECRFIQPDLKQAELSLTEDSDDEDGEMEGGLYIFGPCEPSRRPIIANVSHSGPGELYAAAFSVDGTHQCVIHDEEGQFFAEDKMTEIKAGKEYMLLIAADGEWNISFNEGY